MTASVGTWTQKAAKTAARTRMGRLRVCVSCADHGDQVLGSVHSELSCDRCGVVPCVGAIVQVKGGFVEPTPAA